jgi:hypothetical protein
LFVFGACLDGTPAAPFVESFWHWKSFVNYVSTLGMMAAFLFVVTFLCHEQVWFCVTLGTLSSGIEVSQRNIERVVMENGFGV